MLNPMVAMPTLDSVVSLLWIGGLALVLVGRAVLVWLRFRYATRSALHARRLADSTKQSDIPAGRKGLADVLPFQRKPPSMPTGPQPEV
jgi:hypothetical protein